MAVLVLSVVLIAQDRWRVLGWLTPPCSRICGPFRCGSCSCTGEYPPHPSFGRESVTVRTSAVAGLVLDVV